VTGTTAPTSAATRTSIPPRQVPAINITLDVQAANPLPADTPRRSRPLALHTRPLPVVKPMSQMT